LSARALALISAVILAGLVGLLVLTRDRETGASATAGDAGAAPASGASTGEPGVAADRPSAPSRPGEPPRLPAPDTPGDRFEDEPRDDRWSGDKAGEVGDILRDSLAHNGLAGAVRVEEVECRTERCRLRLAVEQPERLDDVLSVIGDERGFHGKANGMRIHDMVTSADGTPTGVSVTLSFRRDPAPGPLGGD
jgi:hypothetical protein